MEILILGAGGHAWVVADIFLRAQKEGASVRLIGCLDDDSRLHGSKILGVEVVGSLNMVKEISHDGVVVAIGSNRIRSQVYKRLQDQGEKFVQAVHPSAIISPDVKIGAGSMICGGVIVNPGTVIGQNVIVNTGSTIDHHNKIGNHVHIAPGVHTGGETEIGEGTLVGIGSIIMPRCSVGSWSIVGAGSLVHKNLPGNIVAFGVPANIVRKNEV